MANTTFKMNGWIYTYNEPMTSNWGWPEGKKGERTRILKKQMLQLLKERDAFNTPFEEIEETAEAAQEAPSSPAEADNEPVEEQERAQIESATETAEEAESTEEPTLIEVAIPIDGHTSRSLGNLINLVYTRAGLINKALGTQFSISDALISGALLLEEDFEDLLEGKKNSLCSGIRFNEGRIYFSASLKNPAPETIQTFMALTAAMNQQALTQRRIQAKAINDENEKYAMRIWLTRLGMNGPDYKETRRILMQNLSGHAAFRTEAEKEKWNQRHARKKASAAQISRMEYLSEISDDERRMELMMQM